MKKIALFIGRFQPFHLGHLGVIKQAIKENDRLFIGIGSAEANFRPANPFTCAERFQMIEAALDEANIPREKYAILTIRNIENYALWPKHVELYIPPFSHIYTASDTVRDLYQYENKTRKNPYKIIEVKKTIKVSSTQIRNLMLKGKKWQHLVPKSVEKLLTKWNGVKRLMNVEEAEK